MKKVIDDCYKTREVGYSLVEETRRLREEIENVYSSITCIEDNYTWVGESAKVFVENVKKQQKKDIEILNNLEKLNAIVVDFSSELISNEMIYRGKA